MKVHSFPIDYKGCIFRTKLCIQVSQEASKVVWYSHLFKNFPQFVVIHTLIINKFIYIWLHWVFAAAL